MASMFSSLSEKMKNVAVRTGLLRDDGRTGYRGAPQYREEEYDDQGGYAEPEEDYQGEDEYEYDYRGGYAQPKPKPKARTAPARRPAQQQPVPAAEQYGRPPRPAQPQGREVQPRGGNVVHMRPEQEYEEEYYDAPAPAPRARQDGGVTQMITCCVRRLEDGQEIIGSMMMGRAIVISFESVDDILYQRVLDLVSGAAFALEANISRVSTRGYLISPAGVEIVRTEAPARAPAEERYSAGYY